MPFGVKKAAAELAALTPDQLLQQAFQHRAAQKWKECESCCLQLVRDNRKSHLSAAYAMLGQCAMKKGAGLPWDMARKSLEFYTKSIQDEHQASHASSEQWSVHKSSVLREMAEIHVLVAEFDQAEKCLQKLLKLDSTWSAYDAYAKLLKDQGRIQEAIERLKEFQKMHEGERSPTVFGAGALAAFARNYISVSKEDVDCIYAESVLYGNQVKELFAEHHRSEHTNVKDTMRRLKIGYVSGDLNKTHAVARFAWVLLELDRTDFEIIVYNSKKMPADNKMSDMVDKWVDVHEMNTEACVQAIVADEIDILVDLAGFSSCNRLDAFSCAAAPVQVTWIGYPNTTGLKSIHYRVTDAVTDPPDTTQQYAEKLIRLPDCFLCYAPAGLSETLPPVATPPFEKNGFITFGSFNTVLKVKDECVMLWCRVLNAVPNSRIVIKTSSNIFSSLSICEEWYAKFEAHNISRQRVTLLAVTLTYWSHMEAYKHLDIALDSFPYTGTTTTVEAVLMGVPVLTLRSTNENCIHAHNVSAGILSALGQPDWIAATPDQYIDIAATLASDTGRLGAIRAGLRHQFQASPMGDSARYRQNVQDLYRGMWQEYCQGAWPPNS